MNRGLSDSLRETFLDVIPVERPLVGLPSIINPYWFVGFVDAEGCFFYKCKT